MSIQTALENLQQDITNARTAVTNKGGTITTGGGSSQLATDIATIPTGITPTGNIPLTASTTTQTGIDVTNYATASVAPTPSESKTLTLGSSAPTTVTPTSGKYLSSVPVTLDTSVIKAENIAKDVQILGITGTHEGGSGGSVLDISPVTENGTYTAPTGITTKKSITLNSSCFNTGISLPDVTGLGYDFEIKFIPTSLSSTQTLISAYTSTGYFYIQLSSSSINVATGGSTGSLSYSFQSGTEYTLSIRKSGSSQVMTIGETSTTLTETSTKMTGMTNLLVSVGYANRYTGTIKYIKIFNSGETTPLYWLVPAVNSSDTTILWDKVNYGSYAITDYSPAATLGETDEEINYIGFASPLTVNVENFYNGSSAEDFWPNTTTNHNIVFPDTSLTSDRQYEYMFNRGRGGLSNVSVPNLTTVNKAYVFSQFAFYGRIKSFTADAVTSITDDHAFYQFAQYCNTIEKFSMKNLKTITPNYSFYYAWSVASNANANLTEVDFSSLETIANANAFNYAFQYQNKLYPNKVAHPFPSLTTVSSSNASIFGACWKNGRAIMYVFDKLPGVSTASSGAYMFLNAFQSTTWDKRSGDTEGRKSGVAFPCATQVGYEGSTAVHTACKNLMTSSSGNRALYMPELETIYNNNTTNTNGHFASCNVTYIYMPKLSAMGTKPEYTFYSSTNTTELHFGIENQATIEAITGYSSKFGATQATIYFDLANHLTINGGTYDRTGSKDDYDNWYMCFSDGTTDYYIDNFTGAVGDTVYTKSGDTYTATGYTVTAVS